METANVGAAIHQSYRGAMIVSGSPLRDNLAYGCPHCEPPYNTQTRFVVGVRRTPMP